MDNKRKITFFDISLIALRSLFIQASWNFNKMQSLGFLYTISGALKKIATSPSTLNKMFLKHIDFFNTNPYFSSAIAGAVVKCEEDLSINNVSKDDPDSIKASLMGPFGAIGDSVFWATLRPLVSVIALIVALRESILSAFLFLILYNIFSLGFRFYGAFAGYKSGKDIIFDVRRMNLYHVLNEAKMLMAILLGVCIPLICRSATFKFIDSGFIFNMLIVLSAFHLIYFLLSKNISTKAVIYIILFLCLIWEFIFPLL